jgi:uncharacterized protein YaaW (UPF0174 family)
LTEKAKHEFTPKDMAQKILSEVSPYKAFYFFNGVGNYSGIYARSLGVFSNKLKIIDKKSIDFHIKRSDFENWVRSTLGDKFLANEISKIDKSFDEEQLITLVCKIIDERIKELKQLLADEEPFVEHDDDL